MEMNYGNVFSALSAGSANGLSALSEAGTVIIIGLVVVFLALIALTFIFWIFGRTMHKEVKHQPVVTPVVPAVEPMLVPASAQKMTIQNGVSEEVVAVIAAAIAAMSPEGTRYAIRSVSRVRGERSAWAAAGLAENTRPF